MVREKSTYILFFRFLKEEHALIAFLDNVNCHTVNELEKRFVKDNIAYWMGCGFDWSRSKENSSFWRNIDYKWITLCTDLKII